VWNSSRPEQHWWQDGTLDSRPIHEILAARDIGAVFRFLGARGWSRAALAAATGLAETRIRQIRAGTQHVESYEVLQRIADGLGVPRGLMGLAYANTPDPDPDPRKAPPQSPNNINDDPAAYDDFVGVLAALAVGTVPPNLPRLLPHTPIAVGTPPVVTLQHVEVLREISARHRHFDADHGGGSCRDSAVAYLNWAAGMLTGHFANDTVERALKAGLSDLYQVVGWACHDLGDHGAARRYLACGLALARDIDDLLLIAGSFYRLGRVSIHQHRAAEALKLWQLGQIVAQDSGNLVAVAVLHANEAWAYAQIGDDARVCDSLARAESELDRADSDAAPGWAQFFLAPADIDGLAGVIYTQLAAHQQHRTRYTNTAIERSQRAFNHRRTGETRSRTFDVISMANAHLLDEDLTNAERYGHLALDMTAAITSVRAVDRLLSFTELAQPHLAHPGVAEVVARVGLLPTG